MSFSSNYDLVLKGGRLLDPAAGRDEICDIAFSRSKVAAISSDKSAEKGVSTLDVTGKYVVPGLIDMHSHTYWGGTSLSVDAETIAWKSGTTTFVDAGSAGAGNFEGFRKFIIEKSPLHIFSLLNISYAGIFGFGKHVSVGECGDLDLLNVRECFETAASYPEIIKGVKVRAGRSASNYNGLVPVRLALEVADMIDMPLMTHIDFPPPGIGEVLSILRAGDILTHCFRPSPNAATEFRSGMVRDIVLEAREKGIYFDIGHGMASMSFDVARSMLEQGFMPDTISSDVHQFSVNGPAYDLLTTMSKFLCLGMEMTDLIQATTATPAKILGLKGLGTLAPGSEGDAVVLEIVKGEFEYQDASGETLIGDKQLRVCEVILGGSVWEQADVDR